MKKSNKISAWLDRPITRRDCAKMCGYSVAATVVIEGAYFAWYFREEIGDWLGEKIEKIKNRKETEHVDYVDDETLDEE